MEDFAERINRYIAEREKFDPVAVYEQMKDVYAVVVTMEPAYDYEIPVLRGESSAGKFEVWDNGLDIIFVFNCSDRCDKFSANRTTFVAQVFVCYFINRFNLIKDLKPILCFVAFLKSNF